MDKKIKSICMEGRKEGVLSGIQQLEDKYGSEITMIELIDKLEGGK